MEEECRGARLFRPPQDQGINVLPELCELEVPFMAWWRGLAVETLMSVVRFLDKTNRDIYVSVKTPINCLLFYEVGRMDLAMAQKRIVARGGGHGKGCNRFSIVHT